MKVSIRYKGNVIGSDIVLADNFWLRLSGYMFRKSPHVAGILFEPAKAIRSIFSQPRRFHGK